MFAVSELVQKNPYRRHNGKTCFTCCVGSTVLFIDRTSRLLSTPRAAESWLEFYSFKLRTAGIFVSTVDGRCLEAQRPRCPTRRAPPAAQLLSIICMFLRRQALHQHALVVPDSLRCSSMAMMVMQRVESRHAAMSQLMHCELS